MLNFTPHEPYQPILDHYPDAVDSRIVTHKFLELAADKFNLSPQQIVLAASICSDDINNIEYPPNAREMLGPFTLGGLNGYPFTGVTGMTAFVHHVPAKGAMLIFYAPHIGISRGGEVGKIRRPGQVRLSSCCGAADLALRNLTTDKIIPLDITTLDYQQNTIEQTFLLSKQRITAAQQQVITATEVMYEAICERIHLLLEKMEFENAAHLFVAGGILINADDGCGSYIALREFTHKALGQRALGQRTVGESILVDVMKMQP